MRKTNILIMYGRIEDWTGNRHYLGRRRAIFLAVRDFHAGQKGRVHGRSQCSERAKVRNGKVSFQAAINRRGASHLTTPR